MEHLPQWVIMIASLIGGGIGLEITRSIVMSRKDKTSTEQDYIKTLLNRIAHLEGRIDQQGKLLMELVEEIGEIKSVNKQLSTENAHLMEKVGLGKI